MDKSPGIRKRIALNLFSNIRRSRVRIHELRTLFWECTLRCNSSCRHCGSDCHVSAGMKDMPMEDFLKVIDSITPHVEPNKVKVIFTGGEPLLRKDLELCGNELYSRGYPWGIVTNGLLLTQERLKSLLAAGLHSVTIGLDGFEEAHNWLRRHPKSFENALNAICLLAEEKKIDWEVVTCVNQQNFNHLKLLREFLFEMGVKRWRLSTLPPIGQATEEPDLQLSNEQFTQLLNFIRYCRKKGQMHVSYDCGGFLGNYEAEVRDSIFQCKAGINTASVLADGSISGCPCIGTKFQQGSIYKDQFIDVWNNAFKPYRDRSWSQKGVCADCDMFGHCQGNGMHLYDDEGNLLFCHYKRIV